ncbi:unnamed protein product [Caenorhabditis sp. 36 PRJEB53466]|nr:unnamed protein product [Caenorhabditis sp. 36 PRJEB53466]
MRWFDGTFLLLLVSSTHAQFGEIASLATSLLGGALGNGAGLGALAGAGAAGAGAAGQAGGALAQIGQLYQLAQGALQLTGTGVGVLNQASEGNWFPAVLEQTAKNSQAFMKGGNSGINLGALGPAPGKSGGGAIGPEFGTNFPAPDIDDYDENAEIPGVTTDNKTPKAPDGLVDIEDRDYEIETTKAATTTKEIIITTTEAVTPFPDEDEEETEPTTLPPRQIRIQLPDKNGKTEPEEELDYEDLINKKTHAVVTPIVPTIDAESTEELKKNVIATHGTKTQPIVPKLDKLVEVLQKSKLSREEIDEIVAQVEGNKHIEKPAKYDFNAAVQNIPDKKNLIRQKITDASRIISTSFENQRKEQNVVIQKQVDEFKVLPDLTESTVASITATTKAPPTTTTIITTAPTKTSTTPKHIQQARSVSHVAPVAPSVALQTTVPQTAAPQGQVQQPQPQPYNNYLYPQQPLQHIQHPFHQQQQVYYTQAPFYGQHTQNYWGQQNHFAPQLNQYGLHNQQPQQPQPQQVQQNFGYSTPLAAPSQPYPQQQNQYYAQYVPQQQQQQQFFQQPRYSTTVPQQIPHSPTQPVQQPATYAQQRQPSAQQVVYQQGSAQPTAAPVPQVRPPVSSAYPQPNGNTNQVVHYYHDGRQIVQQIIPKKIAATGNLPLNGPFQSQNVGATDPAEYQRKQRALQQAFQQPQTRAAVATKSTNAGQQSPANPQPAAHVQPRVYESTVTATGNRHAHAIRTYQATKPDSQPAAATRSSGRVSFSKKRISGHVLPGPTIDHRSLLEKRTTAKPRYVRVP